jgi:hypothetical protein
MTRMKRVKYLRPAAAAIAAILVMAVPASAASAHVGIGPSTELGTTLAAVKGPFIYTVQATVPGVVKRIDMWTSVDGSRSGAERWTKCSMEGRTTPQCLILIPKGRGPDGLNDRTYVGVENLSADPAVLAAYLEGHNSCNAGPGNPMLSASQAAFSEIVMITDAVPVLPPRYGSILFHAAAKIPGAKVLAHVTSAAGASGTAVSMLESSPRIGKSGRNWGRIELIFAPRTFQYVGMQQWEGPSAHGPWTVINATSLRSYKFVKTAPHNYTGDASMGTTVCVSP